MGKGRKGDGNSIFITPPQNGPIKKFFWKNCYHRKRRGRFQRRGEDRVGNLELSSLSQAPGELRT